jgi:Flp pilus assembly protein TadG
VSEEMDMKARTNIAMSLSRFLRKSATFVRCTAGTVAIEFSFILPIMVAIWLGGVELTTALAVDRKVVTLTASIGDITARSKKVTESQISSLFGLATPALFPTSAENTTMVITAVDFDDEGNATVGWSRADGTDAYAVGLPVNDLVPAVYRVPNTQIIMAESNHPHLPKIGYKLTDTINFDNKMFFTPRLSTYVQLCDNSGNNCVQ